MKKLYLAIVIAFMASACKKTQNEPPVSAREVLSSSKFYYTDGTYYETFYEYDHSGFLTRHQDRTSEGRLMSYRSYHYEAGKLKDVILNSASAKVAQYHYTYKNNKPAKFIYQEYKNGTIRNIFEQVYEYQGTQLSRITMNHLDGSASYYTNIAWEGKNIKYQKTYSLPEAALKEEAVYEYDNAINPLNKISSISVGNPRYNSVNNVTKITNTRTSTGATEEIISDFEYDSSNRPVKQYNRFKDGSKMHEQSYSY